MSLLDLDLILIKPPNIDIIPGSPKTEQKMIEEVVDAFKKYPSPDIILIWSKYWEYTILVNT